MIQDDLLREIRASLSSTTLIQGIGAGLVAVGGSVSYGYDDEHSDIDLVVAVPQEIYGDLRSLGSVQNDLQVQNRTAHFIPVELTEYFGDIDTAPIERLFEQEHLVPVYDPGQRAGQRKTELGGLAEEWWIARRLGIWSRICDRWGRLRVTVKRAYLLSADILWGEMLADAMRWPAFWRRNYTPRCTGWREHSGA